MLRRVLENELVAGLVFVVVILLLFLFAILCGPADPDWFIY
jgi:hypothetical protein